MSTSVALQGSPGVWEPPIAKPLDEGIWQAWQARGRAHDLRISAAALKAVKWVSIASLLVAAGLWSHVAAYQVVVRFIVFVGAIFVAVQAVRARHFGLAAAFGALALLYNPVAPVFDFSGQWQLAVVVASALPFAASLVGGNVRLAHHS